MSQLFALLALLAVLASGVHAQQFVSRSLPGPVVWSEAAIPFDADEDGDLDVLIMNAQGYKVPGDLQAPSDLPLLPTLLLNDGNDLDGFPIWTDASAARLPADLLVHGKFAAVGDYDGDGHEDLALAVAFGARQRLLRKDSGSGNFVDESLRLPTLVLNSLYVAAGDLDDDGDLDLVYTDAGPDTFFAPGGKARLLLNDGAGFFTDEPARLGAALKIGAQNAKLIDIDGDLDLDILVDGKSPATQLYVNDGTGVFALDLITVPGATALSGSTYEMDYADLDGDGDFDAMLMNLNSNWRDAAVQNLLDPVGGLAFDVPSIPAIDAPNTHDENDFAFLDVDDDGDLDVLVARLESAKGGPPTSEALWLNAGRFADDFLVDVPGAFDVGVDWTLDLAVADFNGDGRYDVISVQGEAEPFGNVFHRNTGAIDTRPPEILRVTPGGTIRLADALDGIPIRAVVCDAVVDDGHSFVTAELVIESDKGGETTSSQLPMPYVGGYVHRAGYVPTPTATGLVGMDLSWRVEATDPLGQTAVSPVETARLCGTESFGSAAPLAGLALAATGVPIVGQPFGVDVSGGPPDAQGLLLFGFGRVSLPLKGGTLHVDPNGMLLLDLDLDASGSTSLQTTLLADPGWVGLGAVLQYAALDPGQPQSVALSNGLEFAICAD